MTQSDSPDFEFDISDLEVEREESAASKEGSTASGQVEATDSSAEVQDFGKKEPKPDPRADFDESDRELDVFEIDDLPSAGSESPPANRPSKGVEETPPVKDDVEPQPVQRIENKPEQAPSRVLGEDDLGADVFAEIDSELGSMGLDDVIDDLMDEVEDYEAGGFVDLDEEESAESSSNSDELFKMEDPDDSLRNSIDPNADDDGSAQESAAFPSPPTDFEIPADPEPSRARAPESSESSQETEPVREVPAVEDTTGSEPLEPKAEPAAPLQSASHPSDEPASALSSSDFEIPADPVPSQAESAIPAKAPSPSEVKPTTTAKAEEPDSEPLEPNTEPAAQAASVSEPEVSSVKESEAPSKAIEAEAETESLPSEDESDLGSEEPTSSAEGHEQVLFSSDQEEAVEEVSLEDEEDLSELLDSVLEEEDEAEPALESAIDDLSDESTATLEDADEAPQPEVAVSEAEEENEDLSALLEAIEEEDDSSSDVTSEESLDVSENSEETVSDSESFGESVTLAEAEPDSDPAAIDGDAGGEDVSELLASVLEEAEEDASDEEAIQGLEEIPDDEEVSDEPEATDVEAAETSAEEEEDLIELPSPEDLMADNLGEEDAESEDASQAAGVPSLVEVDEDLDEEDISSLLEAQGDEGSVALEPDSPSADVVEDDEEEVVAMPVPEVPGLVEVDEEEDEAQESVAESSAAPAVPSAEELLMQAGSLLNGDSQKPAEGASALLDVIDDDDDEIVSMPSPDAMMAEATDDDDDEVVSLPDPSSLITADGEAIAVIEDEEEDIPAPGNVADRAGDLPPPPPAPIEILDEEPPDEDLQAATEEESEDRLGETALQDPFENEISLDDFDDSLSELGGEDGESSEEEAGDELIGEETGEGEQVAAKKEVVEKVVEMPKPSLLWRVTHSMAVAAGLVLVGLAGVLAVWKQQIIEYYDGRDIDGSALLLEIEKIGIHALRDFDEEGLYQMQWVDSEVRRVSENEIRLHAVVGARLRENLYRPVLESRLQGDKGYDEGSLLESLRYARDHFPEEIGNYPDRPWDRLYEISARKEEVLPLRVTYALKREDEELEWDLARIRVSGYKGDLEWPEGEPRYAFGENAYDIHSPEFAKVYDAHSSEAQNYVARIDRMRAREEDELFALRRENERQRERVKMALAEGSFFDGLAIMGEDAADSRDVQLVITEVRNEGGFVKGVLKLSGMEQKTSKHFVGSLEFEKSMSGREQGYLSLRTVSIDSPGSAETAESEFFDARSVSRMRLRADGFRLEGDSRDLSFRLTRNL
ncbi:hypothetical protein [Pelagicoccus sp. SDUM812002]|uniref:hypothetical protein n=1 Tax=Pelagicoccus sp. SDUM812002 TaxID=3041266 RepID=UPI00280F4106|nr:hypothetical protein [Pelagicoccus sp. SDUM812002]MDQ8185926.1 hypothetical protein [Pelagicoccus sp. SDUM812002]